MKSFVAFAVLCAIIAVATAARKFYSIYLFLENLNKETIAELWNYWNYTIEE